MNRAAWETKKSKRYGGTKESLRDKSYRHHSVHPNAHTEQELMLIFKSK